jgi:DNA-binding transcriptional MerR regulator/methylmalonyl-CoA mutase cobalamin-binding subunit
VAEIQHTIKTVSRRTGLSAHVIRVWERRYGAVQPQRTGTNRRLYSEDEVQRLELLHRATEAGHSISQAAKLPTDKLREILLRPVTTAPEPDLNGSTPAPPETALIAQCLAAVKRLDAAELDAALERGMIQFGQMGFLNRLAAPLSHQVGELWCTGELTAAHEHFLSAALRTMLGQAIRQFAHTDLAPAIVVATPVGQLHELGAVMVAALAANLGWRVTYLGTSLPAAEIAGAAIQNQARVVALSLVYPEDDRGLPAELSKLRRYLPAEIKIMAGGRAAPAYKDALDGISALRTGNLESLAVTLQDLRTRSV